jgi:hypothetical protein
MKKMSKQHDRAMAIADDADLASKRGDEAEAARLYRAAFDLERAAADGTANHLDLEPTRSILHRSAASLALQVKEYRACEQLLCRALAGNPPADISDELRTLWEQCSFSMHLRARDFEMSDNELLVSMWGKGVGFGYADCTEVVDRLSSTQKLLYRTVERTTKQPYRDQGDVPRIIRENFQVWSSLPKAASYAFVLRVGSRDPQGTLFDAIHAARVVDEVMECLALVSQHDYARIEQRMGSKAYFRNFIGLTRQIAPTGREVSSVGFASQSKNARREVVVVPPNVRRVTSAPLFSADTAPQREPVDVDGQLLFADARQVQNNRIEVRDAQGITHTFLVPKGLMADVVRPYFEKSVRVHGVRRHNVVALESISPLEDR